MFAGRWHGNNISTKEKKEKKTIAIKTKDDNSIQLNCINKFLYTIYWIFTLFFIGTPCLHILVVCMCVSVLFIANVWFYLRKVCNTFCNGSLALFSRYLFISFYCW